MNMSSGPESSVQPGDEQQPALSEPTHAAHKHDGVADASRRRLLIAAAAGFVGTPAAMIGMTTAQEAAAPDAPAAAPAGAPAAGAAADATADAASSPSDRQPAKVQQTQFAPGILNVIPPAPHPKETFSGPLTLQGLIDSHPEIQWKENDFPGGRPSFDPRTRTLIEMARQVTLRREIFCLEFSFKPLRMIYLDIPQPNGQLARRLIWYMVYRVRYRGGDLRPATDLVGKVPVFRRVESVGYDSRRAFPMLLLEDHILGKQYLDRVLPTAKKKIAVREQITAPLYDSVEITTVDIPRSNDDQAPGVWGVATWEGVDAKVNFCSVYVFGLTNAFDQKGLGADEKYLRKALRLNFFRPGDTINQTEDQIRFGVPAYQDSAEQDYVLKQYGIDSRLDYDWVFR